MRTPLLVPLAAAALLAQTRSVGPLPKYEVKRAQGRIAVNGLLDDEAWRHASPAVEFVFPWDNQTGAKQKTRAKLLWDSDYLYVGYECDDEDIVAVFGQRDDPTYRDDAVEIFIHPGPKYKVYWGFEMNSKAIMYDYVSVPGVIHLTDSDVPGSMLATTIRGTLNQRGDKDQGWTLELAIPWRAFRDFAGTPLPPKKGDIWRANLNRWDGVEPNRRLSQWSDSALNTPNPHNPERFGELVFVD